MKTTTHQTLWMQLCLAGLMLASAYTNAMAAYIPPKVTISVPTTSSWNVPEGTEQAELGRFVIEVQNAPVQVRRENAHFYPSSTRTTSDITGVTFNDITTGKMVAGPINPFQSTTDGHWVAIGTKQSMLAVGKHTIIVRGNLSTRFNHNETIKCATWFLGWSFLDPATNKYVFPSPWSLIANPPVTVKTAWLTASLGTWPISSTVISGTTNVLFATLGLDARDSSEDVAVNSIRMLISPRGSSVQNLLNMVVWNGQEFLCVRNAPEPEAGNNVSVFVTFPLTPTLIIPKGTTKSLTLTANVSAATLSGSAFQFGLHQPYGDLKSVDAYGITTEQAVTLTIKEGFASCQTVMRSFSAPGLVSAYDDTVITVDPHTQTLNRYRYDRGMGAPTTNPQGTGGAIVISRSVQVANPIAVGYKNNNTYIVTGKDEFSAYYDDDLKFEQTVPLYGVKGLVKGNPLSVITDLGIIDLSYGEYSGILHRTNALWLNGIRDAIWNNGNVFLITGSELQWYRLNTADKYELVQRLPFNTPVAVTAYQNFVDVTTAYAVYEYWNDGSQLRYVGATSVPNAVQVTADGDGIYVMSKSATADGAPQTLLTRFGILPDSTGHTLPITKSLIFSGQARDMGRAYDPVTDQFDGTQYLLFNPSEIMPLDLLY